MGLIGGGRGTRAVALFAHTCRHPPFAHAQHVVCCVWRLLTTKPHKSRCDGDGVGIAWHSKWRAFWQRTSTSTDAPHHHRTKRHTIITLHDWWW
uniref:Putative secreted protein n=1 Tax=Anopheles darlingi TaxID=43151 RepID=A0A2M4DAA3_ANODA